MALPQQQKIVAEAAFQYAAIARICTAMTVSTPFSSYCCDLMGCGCCQLEVMYELIEHVLI